LPWLASNLVVHPDIKAIPDLAGKYAGISRFGSSTDQGFRYLFRKNNLSVDRDLKMLQMGGDSSRVAAMKTGTIQYTFLGVGDFHVFADDPLAVSAIALHINDRLGDGSIIDRLKNERFVEGLKY